MTDKLTRDFLPRFFGLAKSRLDEAMRTVEAPSPERCSHVAMEMHSLAGEAGLLGRGPMTITAARQVERAATDLGHAPDDERARACLRDALERLSRELRTEERPSLSASAVAPRSKGTSIREKFRARFNETAMTRYRTVAHALESGGEAGVARARSELHTLGGEASMLAMTSIATLCRDGEEAARANDRDALASIVAQLEVAIFAEELGVRE